MTKLVIHISGSCEDGGYDVTINYDGTKEECIQEIQNAIKPDLIEFEKEKAAIEEYHKNNPKPKHNFPLSAEEKKRLFKWMSETPKCLPLSCRKFNFHGYKFYVGDFCDMPDIMTLDEWFEENLAPTKE